MNIREDLMPKGKLKVTDEQILSVFEASDDPVLSAKEVAGELGITTQGAFYRLETLKEEGKLKRKSLSRDVAWWQAD